VPRELSPWCKRAKIAMIEKGIKGIELARELGYSRTYVTAILNGREKCPPAIKRISDYLNISDSDKKEIDDNWN
jgi:transcriptional regulator with XRE-family HTH domain